MIGTTWFDISVIVLNWTWAQMMKKKWEQWGRRFSANILNFMLHSQTKQCNFRKLEIYCSIDYFSGAFCLFWSLSLSLWLLALCLTEEKFIWVWNERHLKFGWLEIIPLKIILRLKPVYIFIAFLGIFSINCC